MRGSSFFAGQLGLSMQEFLALPRDRAAALLRDKIPDLLYFLRQRPKAGAGNRRGAAGREEARARRTLEPRRTLALAASLEAALAEGLRPTPLELQSLRDRIIVDGFMRVELDRDQNVYLGPFFTRTLTRATPDVVFQAATHREVELALAWARCQKVGVATRGAGTTALGGSVPNEGGLLLELSRFDQILVDRQDGVAVMGAGARFKHIHARLAAEGLALATYPSNLGGTLGGWFSAGGVGLNSFKYGPVQTQVRALSVVLPRGEHVRFHDDNRLDLLSPEAGSQRLGAEEGTAWLEAHGYPALRLADLAQTEGQFGVILTLTMTVRRLPRFTPFYFETEDDAAALRLVRWVTEKAAESRSTPANLKYLSASHVAAVRAVRDGAAPGKEGGEAKPAVYLDFDEPEEARRFTASLEEARGAAPAQTRRDDAEARRWFADRFRPQQTKRLGPGFLAAEVIVPVEHVGQFLERAGRLAARVGVSLETEIYYLEDGRALVLPGYLSRGPRRGFLLEILLAPILVELAMSRFAGEPYVLGRWQSPLFGRKHPQAVGRWLRRAKKQADPGGTLNPGVFFGPVFRLPGARGFFRASFPGGMRFLRSVYGSPLTAPVVRAFIGAGRVATERETMPRAPALERRAIGVEEFAHAARGCVNCGECNSVCPVFHDAKIRLPQMLTHLGETLPARGDLAATPQLLLDLCTRCGNCQEVCQADVPHLDMYAALEARAGDVDEARRERHVAILAHLRHSERYLRGFLGVRPGGYLQRTPASLPGAVRYVLFRAENDAGPADTCLHCGACATVCPTHANLEYQDEDARRMTTVLGKCIGCGVCVEACPANVQNGGRTLRVMEAPTREFFEVLAAFESAMEGSRR